MKKSFWVIDNEQLRDYTLSDVTAEYNLPKGDKVFWLKNNKGHVCNILQTPNNSEQQLNSSNAFDVFFFEEFHDVLYYVYPKIVNLLDAMAFEKAIHLLHTK